MKFEDRQGSIFFPVVELKKVLISVLGGQAWKNHVWEEASLILNIEQRIPTIGYLKESNIYPKLFV